MICRGCFLIVIALMVALIGVMIIKSATETQKPHCTHGISSIGPVTISGKKVTGNTTPHTEACLP